MKKFLAIAAAVICLIAGTTSCNKGGIVAASYKFDQTELENMQYVTGHETEVVNFIQSLNTAMGSFSGTEFTDSQIIGAVQKVVDNYNNNVIKGTFSLYKALGESEDYNPIKTWTMNFAN